MSKKFPFRMTVRQKAHMQSLAAPAGAKHSGVPKVSPFSDEVDDLRLEGVRQILNDYRP